MQHSPSSLSQLSHAEKDALILLQQGQIMALQEAVAQLQAGLNMNSRNSSKPPSSDGLNKPNPKSSRVAGQRPSGGQKGHSGSTLRQAAQPDTVVVHDVPDQCQACQRKLRFACHAKRGRQAFEAFALLEQFQGVLIHDGWVPYKALQCQHALCNAHHLRELTYLFEEQGQEWAGDMMELLGHANHTDNVNCPDGKVPRYETRKYQSQVGELRDLYEAILATGEAQNPAAASTGKRGRPKQSKATNLLARLRQYSDEVWRFMLEPDVPFTNNLAEQAVRMPKVKQKVSGCFRTLQGAQTYSVIRSYAATMHKQGANIFESLAGAFNGNTPKPRFG